MNNIVFLDFSLDRFKYRPQGAVSLEPIYIKERCLARCFREEMVMFLCSENYYSCVLRTTILLTHVDSVICLE